MKQQRDRHEGKKASGEQRPETEHGHGKDRAAQDTENERNQGA
jgi:hypothetical protein